MKICAAQIQSKKGSIAANINKHLRCIEEAVRHGARVIIFPELSLTSYEPTIAHNYVFTPDNQELEAFQQLADIHDISILIGAPTITDSGLSIGMFIYQKKQKPLAYAKQFIHADEEKYFCAGTDPRCLEIDGQKAAVAICYESRLPKHIAQFEDQDLDFYLASVSKPQNGVDMASLHYEEISKRHKIGVLMCNAVGPADNFIAAGQSGYWSPNNGEIKGLDATSEALLIVDTLNDVAEVVALK